METAVLSIISVPAIVAIVNLLKGLGLTGKWSALAAVLIAVGLVAGQAYAPSELFQTISNGLTLGLGAAGLYDVTSKTAVAQDSAPERALEE